MAKKRVWQMLSQNLAFTNLSLEAKFGQGYEIIDLGCYGGGAGQIIDCIIGGEKMLSLPADAGQENVCPVEYLDVNYNMIFKTLREKYPDVPLLKISQGESLTIKREVAVGGTGYIFFRELIGDEIPTKDMDGGSEGLVRLFVSHGKKLQSIPAGETNIIELDTPVNPAGYDKFPFGVVAPVGKEFDMLGLCVSKGAGSGVNTTLNGIRVWKGEENILTPGETYCPPANLPYPIETGYNKPLLLPDKLTFLGNERLLIDANVTNAGGAAEDAEVFATLFFIVRVV